MIETEAKIKITRKDFEEFIIRFKNPLFVSQENIIYEIPNGFVRIRRLPEKKIITIKKKVRGEFNSREEIEFEVKGNLEKIEKFMKSLQLKETIRYRKRRANLYIKECIVSIDIIKENYYIEIEGSPDKIREIIKDLGLENHKLENKSYLEILKPR